MTLHARGVPYHVGLTGAPSPVFDVGPVTGLATLTIEPGVTVELGPNAEMRIDAASSTVPARGALIAVGTAAAPIVFTSASDTPAPGDWIGLRFGGIADPATRLEHVRVEYAGKTGIGGSGSCAVDTGISNEAAIRITGGEPATQFITNSEIRFSARHGIDRGFRSDTKPSFLPTNTFANIARCQESYPADSNGGCPPVGSVPCP
jgi:hypothetical protein